MKNFNFLKTNNWMHKRNHRLDSSFTLVELLLVVAIIAVLASLLIPALGKARKTAHSAVCANQMRQVFIGEAQYLDDHKGYYTIANNTYNGHTWDESLLTYWGIQLDETIRKSTNLYHEEDYPELHSQVKNIVLCPSDTGWKSWRSGLLRRTYAFNYRISSRDQTMKQLGLTDPANTFLFVEQQSDSSTFGNPAGTACLDSARWQLHPNWQSLRTFHKTKHYNYNYADGSVRLLNTNIVAAGTDWRIDK